MAKVDKLITYAFMKEVCDIPVQIDEQELEHPIYQAQETLRMLMGDEFYQNYLTNYKANSLSSAYTALQTYLNKYIAWQAYEFWIVKANLKPTRAGFVQMQGENFTPASDVQMANLIKIAKQQSQMYKVQMVDYLNGHSSDFTLYSVNCHGNLTGNTFRITVARSKNKHGIDCNCRRCRS